MNQNKKSISKSTSGNIKKLCVSAIVIALYIAIMFASQSFAFGAYQMRVATSLYSMSYILPFLIIPLAMANSLGNLLGGLGIWDIIGGFGVGIITSGAIFLIRRLKLPKLLIIPVLIFGPGLIVPVWLAPILGVPYYLLALNLCVGQILPAVLGYALVPILLRLKVDEII